MIRRIALIAFAACYFQLGGAPSHAGDLGPPTGPVVLTVQGAVDTPANADAIKFDRAMLRRLPRTALTTETVWTEGPQTFEGVSLADLMDAVGAEGTTIRATALNDYAITIPMSDAADGRALVADRLNGADMAVRAKGPLWIVYPFDDDISLRSETIYARSIWQLSSLEVLP